jgi:hypothetical protein
LEKISPDLFATFGGVERRGKKARGEETTPGTTVPYGRERPKRARDFTNNIKIGDEVFEIETVKGKKIVKLPWERLSRVKDDSNTEGLYKNLRGTIILDDKYTLLEGEKLRLILSLAPTLEMDGVLERKRPGKTAYNSTENLDTLLEELPALVTPAVWKKGSKELGFLGLFNDGDGNYRIRCSRGFHTSLNESLSSLETLIDELGDEVDIEKKHVVNQTYRRLSDLLG